MLDIAAELHQWCQEDRDFAVATVVAVRGSAPRQPGAALAVDTSGTVLGSVSGGCVEAAVYELCERSLSTGETLTETFGYADDGGFSVGLTCGGELDILVTPVRTGAESAAQRSVVEAALSAAVARRPAALARIVSGPSNLLGTALYVSDDGGCEGTLGGDVELDRTACREAAAFLHAGRTGSVGMGAEGNQCGEPVTLFVESSVPPPRMLIFGAVDFAAALARAGKFLGYQVTVCDARPTFATAARFPAADEVVVDWPHRYLDSQALDARTAICSLTHDAKFDIALLQRALRLPVAYVGAMGSRRTHRTRMEALREAGVPETQLARLRSPIGLDLGARTPDETALSIVAEIIALRHNASGLPLTDIDTPIHGNLPHPSAA